MSDRSVLSRRHLVHLVGLLVLVALYGFTRLPRLPVEERRALAANFAFTRLPLPELSAAEYPQHTVRRVHPSLDHIAAWISSVGAAVALEDLDGDGLPNDLCHVDPRFDRVVVAPVPGTGERYAPFVLDARPLPYDAATMAPMGCLFGDLDEDGRMDLLAYYWGRSPVAFLRRGGDGGQGPARERFRAVEVMPGGERWNTNAATRADVDGDGHVDLVIGNYFPDGARILDAEDSGREHMHDSMSRAFNGGHNRVLLWAGSGAEAGEEEPWVRFVEAEGLLPERAERAWTLAVGAADLDGDLLPELYFANDFGPDRLFHNRSRPGAPRLALVEGRKTLLSPSSKVLGHDSFKGMGVDFADLNGDGALDIYVSNIADEYALEESHFLFLSNGRPELLAAGVAPYVDSSESLGLSRSSWGWETRLADLDNDGVLEALQATGFIKGSRDCWPELHELAMGNDLLVHRPTSWLKVRPGDDLSGHAPNPFFVRAADGRYYDLAPELGLDQPYVTRAIATADVDGDGDLDFAIANQWEPSYFFRNDSPAPGASLQLRLLLPAAHGGARPAIGAGAVVELPDGRRLVGQVDGGNGHSGARSQELHFGLGAVAPQTPLRVEITWRAADGIAERRNLSLTAGRHTLVLGGEIPGEEG